MPTDKTACARPGAISISSTADKIVSAAQSLHAHKCLNAGKVAQLRDHAGAPAHRRDDAARGLTCRVAAVAAIAQTHESAKAARAEPPRQALRKSERATSHRGAFQSFDDVLIFDGLRTPQVEYRALTPGPSG